MRVLVVGCGYVGLAVGAELVRQGHMVWGLGRSRRTDGELRAAGIAPLTADIALPESLLSLSGYDWVVNCVSASGGGAPEYERTYLQGTRCLLSWLSDARPTKFVYTSSTSVYGQNDGSTVDETSPTVPEAQTSRILVQAEELLLKAWNETDLPVVLLRVGGIYGPGRIYWVDQVRAGTATIEGGGERILNMIHRDDVAGAVIAALARGRPGEIYNAVDDEPVAQLALFQWLSARLGQPVARAFGAASSSSRKRGVTSKKVSNQKLKEELEYRFRFPTFREGYESVLKAVAG